MPETYEIPNHVLESRWRQSQEVLKALESIRYDVRRILDNPVSLADLVEVLHSVAKESETAHIQQIKLEKDLFELYHGIADFRVAGD